MECWFVGIVLGSWIEMVTDEEIDKMPGEYGRLLRLKRRVDNLEKVLGEAGVILAALDMSVKWELAPEIKLAIAKIVPMIVEVLGKNESDRK
jgi:hypothetical protein